MPRVARLSARAWNIELTEPFGIATGAQVLAKNALIEVELESGVIGLGEAAPFPAVNGDTQAAALAAVANASQRLEGAELEAEHSASFRDLAGDAAHELAASPSARAGVEMALLDAWCRLHGRSMLDYFGAAESVLHTDITIPTGSVASAEAAAARAAERGFGRLKIKIGGVSAADDLNRLVAIAGAAPGTELLLDANASMTPDGALFLMRSLGPLAERVVLFEQPTPRAALGDSARLRSRLGCRIAADESASSVADVHAVARAGAADVINVKTQKSGLGEAIDMFRAARDHGLGLMIGGMVESELSMTVSACLAAGGGGVEFVDLDTPLFMLPHGLSGGWRQAGPRIDLDAVGPGHGVRAEPAAIPGGENLR